MLPVGNGLNTLVYTLRKAHMLFSVNNAGHRHSTRYHHTISLEAYRVLLTIKTFILRDILEFYPFISDRSATQFRSRQ
jgi:hypothetical protein